MARYIDVEPLEDKLKEHIKKTESELMLGALSTFVRLLDITPTADVAPVRHGRWEDNGIEGSTLVKCSACGFDTGAFTFTYCPRCGARMDGDSDETD